MLCHCCRYASQLLVQEDSAQSHTVPPGEQRVDHDGDCESWQPVDGEPGPSAQQDRVVLAFEQGDDEEYRQVRPTVMLDHVRMFCVSSPCSEQKLNQL